VLGGEDVCASLGIQDQICRPAPNTEYTVGATSGSAVLRIVLNEQLTTNDRFGDPLARGRVGQSSTAITVNAVHIQVLGPGNPLMLPVGTEIIISSAHCGADRGG
jgi:hypothetical protein